MTARFLVVASVLFAACSADHGPVLTPSPSHASLFGQTDVTLTGDLAALGDIRSVTVGGIAAYDLRPTRRRADGRAAGRAHARRRRHRGGRQPRQLAPRGRLHLRSAGGGRAARVGGVRRQLHPRLRLARHRPPHAGARHLRRHRARRRRLPRPAAVHRRPHARDAAGRLQPRLLAEVGRRLDRRRQAALADRRQADRPGDGPVRSAARPHRPDADAAQRRRRRLEGERRAHRRHQLRRAARAPRRGSRTPRAATRSPSSTCRRSIAWRSSIPTSRSRPISWATTWTWRSSAPTISTPRP